VLSHRFDEWAAMTAVITRLLLLVISCSYLRVSSLGVPIFIFTFFILVDITQNDVIRYRAHSVQFGGN
jgi:hypothetical protein